ncbi:hypothetical protein LXA43DRAFT_1062533 [Ganoderma leucocontextum]|nr:hypothetical protein LXA43DRAFT_1062533 [Ganoderma leucocontextum]
MPFFDIPFPAPFKAFVTGKTGVGTSGQEQAPRRISWTKLGRSFAGVRKHHGRPRQRRHSIQELGEWSTNFRSDMLPTLSERRDIDVDMVAEGGVTDSELPRAGLYRVPSYSSQGSDSDWTAVQSDGTITPPATMSRASSYKKDVFICEDDEGSKLTFQSGFHEPAGTSEPDLGLFPVKLVKKTMAPLDDDLAFIEQMLNGPQVFIPADPYIYDGPLPATPPPVPQRHLASVKSQ